MTVDTPTAPPSRFTAGDTVVWRRSYPDYPASAGNVLSVVLFGGSAPISKDAAADGDDYLIAFAGADTTELAAGRYSLTEFITDADANRRTVFTASILVAADPHTTGAVYDPRSHAQKMLAAIEAWLETRDPGVASLSVNGRSLQNYAIPDLLALRSRYQFEVAREANTAAGVTTGRLRVRL